MAYDIYDWGYECLDAKVDYLTLENRPFYGQFTVFMNPPFSKACEFVLKSLELGARKIVCFQRASWTESNERQEFWDKYPANRKYTCGDRATSWRHDIPVDQREGYKDPETGKRRAGTPTTHAWYVWEKGHPPGTLEGRIYRDR
jgi:hypothetical protein